MSSQTEKLQNITMSSGGVYSLTTRGAEDVINAATPMLLSALDSMNISKNQDSFTFSDMGTADGGTSLKMVEKLINALRRIVPEININIVYADQPKNDFNGLVQTVLGLGHFSSYLERTNNVYPLFSANSFYKQIIPDNTLDFGFSATAMHWLSSKPCDLSDHVHMVGAEGEQYLSFSAQGKKDWESILLNRARELRSGGQLVLLNFCRDENGKYLGNTTGVNMFTNFADIWQDFMEQGLIREDEYQKMTLPQYYNTVEEFSAPLKNVENPVYQAGLRLKQIETHITACPFAEAFKEHQDAQRFAEEYIPTIRSWNESIFFGALDTQRALEERQQIIRDYYQTYQDQVQESPELHRMDYVHAF
ncbi:MAG: SAM-dependent methyltransferase, partial [SAR324 cluster bacterium]|nr:SAM-dependent methyltransferase [SAR324 cluster bacterium]